ncbi:MAG TPA: 50S ribosomal protein L11 methyltransferase [Polyangiaceae bacterium]|nr:50S ribosomal protein L11 methyltransferase [Polyangiaceae bacterium]
MPDEPRYPQVWIDVSAGDADEASGLLFELGAEAVEERDDATLDKGPGHGSVTLVASFADKSDAEAACRDLDGRWVPRFREVVGDAWRDEWKKHFVPFRLTDRITIKPPWESYERRSDTEVVLELEPGRAFGTGLHPTTALVARALEAIGNALVGKQVLDVGTGSGILALVALALGAARVRATDIDADAIEVTLENAAKNGAADRIDADTASVETLTQSYDVVTANIEARVLIPMSADLGARVKRGGLLVLSGVLTEQADDVQRAFEPFELVDRPSSGEWVAIVLRRPYPGRSVRHG